VVDVVECKSPWARADWPRGNRASERVTYVRVLVDLACQPHNLLYARCRHGCTEIFLFTDTVTIVSPIVCPVGCAKIEGITNETYVNGNNKTIKWRIIIDSHGCRLIRGIWSSSVCDRITISDCRKNVVNWNRRVLFLIARCNVIIYLSSASNGYK